MKRLAKRLTYLGTPLTGSARNRCILNQEALQRLPGWTEGGREGEVEELLMDQGLRPNGEVLDLGAL